MSVHYCWCYKFLNSPSEDNKQMHCYAENLVCEILSVNCDTVTTTTRIAVF